MGDLGTRLTIRMDDDIDAALNRVTRRKRSKAAAVVREALHEYLLENDAQYRAEWAKIEAEDSGEPTLRAAEEPAPYGKK